MSKICKLFTTYKINAWRMHTADNKERRATRDSAANVDKTRGARDRRENLDMEVETNSVPKEQ